MASSPTAAPTTTPSTPEPLTITANGTSITGWETIEVTLMCEGFPNSFEISTSASDPLTGASMKAKEGDMCTVALGKDTVITGYIDRAGERAVKGRHVIRLIGRGLTEDLVDCSAEWPSGQIIGGDALSIANKLAQPYGLTVKLGEGANAGPSVPQWALNYGETGAAIIQRLARNAGLLAYEDSKGILTLGKVGTQRAASGAKYGVNVEAFDCESSMDGRFSDYVCALFDSDIALDVTGPGDIFYDREKDPNVPRHRQLDFVIEAIASDPTPGAFTASRARWEAARRAGQSMSVDVTVDSWRDSGGKLWTPNTIIPVDVPGNRAGTDLILSQVTFRRNGETGTTADLILKPPSALSIEPIALQPVPVDLKGPGQ